MIKGWRIKTNERGIIIIRRKLLPGNFFADSWPRFYDVLPVILSLTESTEFIADLLSRETSLLFLLLFPLREDKSRKFDLNVSLKPGENFYYYYTHRILLDRKINNDRSSSIEERFSEEREKFSDGSFTRGHLLLLLLFFRRRKSRSVDFDSRLLETTGETEKKEGYTIDRTGEKSRVVVDTRGDSYVNQVGTSGLCFKRFLKVAKSVPKGGGTRSGCAQERRRDAASSSFLRGCSRRDSRPPTRHAKRLTVCARERVFREKGKKEGKEKKKGEEKGGGKKCDQLRHELLLLSSSRSSGSLRAAFQSSFVF